MLIGSLISVIERKSIMPRAVGRASRIFLTRSILSDITDISSILYCLQKLITKSAAA